MRLLGVAMSLSDFLFFHSTLERGAGHKAFQIAHGVGFVALVETELPTQIESEMHGDIGHREAVGAEIFATIFKRAFDGT